MTRKFEFRNNDLRLDIAGKEFTVDAFEPDLLERVDAGRIKLAEKGKELQTLSEEGITRGELKGKMEESIKACLEVIDGILGEGASQKIFESREVKFLDAIDVSHFIFNEIADFINKDITNRYSPNRATRRSK